MTSMATSTPGPFVDSTPGPFVAGPLRPAAIWFWIGGLLVAAGVIGAIVWGVSGFAAIDDEVDAFERVPMPGGVITIDEPGGQVIYFENASTESATFRLRIDGPDGTQVETDRYGGDLSYDFGGRSGTAVATFEARLAGDYTVTVTGEGFRTAEVAIGPSIAGDLVRTIVGALAIGAVGLLAGGGTILVTALRRSSARRRRSPPPRSSPPGQSPPTGWSPPTGRTPPAG